MGAMAKFADAVVLRFPRARGGPRGPRAALAELAHARASPSAFWSPSPAATSSARQSALFAVQTVADRGRSARRLRERPGRAAARSKARACSGSTSTRVASRLAAIPSVRSRELRPRLPAHPSRHRVRRAAGGCAAPRPGGMARLGARPRDPPARPSRDSRGCRASGFRRPSRPPPAICSPTARR